MAQNKYWQERFELLEESLLKQGLDTYSDMEKQYRRSMNEIEKDITLWYKRLAKNNNISFAAAKSLLNANELKEFRWTVEEYIERGKENAVDKRWMKELENASAKVHISRLEAMKLQTQQHLEVLYGNQLDSIDKTMKNIYSDGYYRGAFEIQKGLSVGYSFQKLDQNRINKVIAKPWAADGMNFSDRVWSSKDKLVNNLHTGLTQATIRGDPLDKMIRDISEKMNSSKSAAGRLVMTESAFFASASQRDCFNSLDVEQYEILATLDSKTSPVCREMDGKIFAMGDFKAGITAPPFHCWCRSCTIPHFDDNKGSRAARGSDGKTYHVPADMKYDEWLKTQQNNETPDIAKQLSAIMKQQDISPEVKKLFDKYLIDEYVAIDIKNSKPMYYSPEVGKIIVNSKHQNISQYDVPAALTHETIHLIDELESLSVNNAALIGQAIKSSQDYISQNTNRYEKLMLSDLAGNMIVSDLLSNVTENKIRGDYAHSNAYWEQIGTREKELVAALLSSHILNDLESLEVINDIPELKKLLKRLVEEYGKITG